jgi:flagellar protein FlbT
MALKLALKPGERVAVNGAVIVNGGARAELVIENRAAILRERDIMQPEAATTPARRIYLPIMMMILDPGSQARLHPDYEARLSEFAGALSDAQALKACAKLAAAVANGEFYRALTICKSLIEYEGARLAHVA